MDDDLERRRPNQPDVQPDNDAVICPSCAYQFPAIPVNVQAALRDMEARKDAAYLERNQVVAALAKAFPSGTARTAIEGWSADWHGCVYIDLPTGQASWHYHDSQAYLFADLPPYTKPWDGHTTEQKYARLAALPLDLPGRKAASPLDRIRGDLKIAAETFRRYETLHRLKRTPEAEGKANVNAALAERLEATIEATP